MYDNITLWYNSNLTSSYLNMFVNLSLTSDDIDERERERGGGGEGSIRSTVNICGLF